MCTNVHALTLIRTYTTTLIFVYVHKHTQIRITHQRSAKGTAVLVYLRKVLVLKGLLKKEKEEAG